MVIMSPLHYPPQEVTRGEEISEARIGAGAHSDYGCIALLAQDDRGGLQVRNTAGRWIDAKPVPGTFVVNVGDMLARWTNDLFPATLHRVINVSGRDRQSIPFFYDPNWDAPVEVLETCLAEGEQPRYEPTTSLAHLQERFGATMPNLDPALLEPRRDYAGPGHGSGGITARVAALARLGRCRAAGRAARAPAGRLDAPGGVTPARRAPPRRRCGRGCR
jgi:hypothetical protein